MLKKLLKYDLRANLKVFVFIWPAVVLLAVFSRFILRADNDSFLFFMFKGSTLAVFVVAIIAAFAISFIFSAIRFYSGLLGREGYLMHTLPVRSWQLVLSKFISAVVYAGATLILCLLAIALQFIGNENFLETLKNLFSDGITSAATVAIAAMSVCASILQFYCAASLGHLFRKKRLLWTILFWYGLSIATRVIQMILFASESFFVTFIGSFDALVDVTLLVTLAVQIALCVGYFFAAERILSRRLNLE